MRKTYILVLVFVVALAMILALLKGENKNIQQPIACTMEAKICPDGSAVGRTGPNCEFAECPVVAPSDLIMVSSPLPGATVGKKFIVTGDARGTYFFEASFPVVVLDKDGGVLVQTYATAESDWMTENFVPFSATITIPSTYSGPAKLILKKDNPSGLPEHDAAVSFDIVVN